jgi:uncharacterized protein (TIGR03546 family)
MFMRIFTPFRYLAEVFLAADSPRQLAAGVMLGMMIGLVPKGNLIAVGLLLLLFAVKANLATGTVAATLFSWTGFLFDPISHRIGHAVLGVGWLQPIWVFLYDLPLVPWSSFNNTVVLGGLILGVCLGYPVYRVSRRMFEIYQPWMLTRLEAYKLSWLARTNQPAADGRVQ